MFQPRELRRRSRSLGPPVCSIRPFKSSEQYLEAMKEDLAEWLRDLYGLDIDRANFLQVLETGLVLCRHANVVTEAALDFLAEAPAQAQRIPVPQAGVFCNGAAQPGTFQARDNVSNFIQWCRKEMGIQEVLMFETEDLVLRKNVKNVVLCLLELGRRAWRFGVAAPTLVQLEEEIDEELRQELALPPPDPPPPKPPVRRACHFHNLDQMVQSLMSHCTCPVQFPMVKVSEGKYRVGDSNTLIFIRILRNHVMVRIGGGWDTLSHYLDKHDPCRCTSLSHKPGSFPKSPAPPVQHEVRVQDGPSQLQPTMTISRSQSPLPPVDWKTYTSSGRKLTLPTSSSPSPCNERGAGMGVLRDTATPLRCQERLLTPSRRQLPAEDNPPSLQSSSTHRGQDAQFSSLGRREDRHLSEFQRGRTRISWAHEEINSQGTRGRTPTPRRLQSPEVTTKGTPARGPSPLPRSSSPIKTLSIKQPPQGEAPGASLQYRESGTICSPSPDRGSTKIPIQWLSSCPPTPGSSFPGAASAVPMTELEGGPSLLRALAGDRHLTGSRHGDYSVKWEQRDQKLDTRVTSEAGEPRGRSPWEWEGGNTLQPLYRTKEQAINHSPEEILANMKLLDSGGAGGPRGTGPGAIPRSGVYVPSLGGRWPEPGGPYDKVIQELAQGPLPLLKVDLGAWGASPTGSRKPNVTLNSGSPKGELGVKEGGPRPKTTLSDEGTLIGTVPPQGQDCPSHTRSTSLEVPKPLPLDPNSDKAKACASKGKRTLRKPQRVPSIYKLKLRPRIRPRRDHRPEKQPSRIPKPLAYLHLGPARTPTRCRLSRATLGSKGEEASPVDGAFEGEKEAEGKEKQESITVLESSPRSPEDLRSQQLDQTAHPPEEETWV
ncbi:PREDICTED: GAS2-like protein 2 [Chrysochloris asiatica]|uniref:GAS2-like protein 2 n=1 Tax=Chrysochloris asiatica TaxID=185453 RepID=A0A9B0WER5_CHRAS|nr:PREDICTED: GAS2-like protein 2 [Chrysochloris asiatica]